MFMSKLDFEMARVVLGSKIPVAERMQGSLVDDEPVVADALHQRSLISVRN